MSKIERYEFENRLKKIQELMLRKKIDALMIYGDEYRRENLRYVSNFWPIFERGACFIPCDGKPILAGAPEGEKYAREMSVIDDIRNIKEFACVSVPDEIDYPLAKFSSLKEILLEVLRGGRKLGLVGKWDISEPLMKRVRLAVNGLEIVDASPILQQLRLIKSAAEIDCLKEAGRIACMGYEKLMSVAVPGNTELMAAGAAEGVCRAAGAENITFMVFGSGPRTGTIIGRATERVIREGDMVMAALAVQYAGYIATVEYPFVAGKASSKQKKLLDTLFDATNVQLNYLKSGVVMSEMVRAVKEVFRKKSMVTFDVYPPMHGIGLAEAESPYPNGNTRESFEVGMCVNSDISLFGHPDGSNRIEEGFVISSSGVESITPFIRQLCEKKIFQTS